MNKRRLKNKYSTLSEKIYTTLASQIIHGKTKRGTRLVEEDLAENFKISRTPVREALNKLAKDELIEILPYKGGYVKGLTARDITEIYDIRKALEGLAAWLATPLLKNNGIAQVKRIFNKNEASSGERIAHLIKVDRKFHGLIIKSCGNKRLEKMINSLNNIIHIFREMDAPLEGRAKYAISEHKKVLEAIEKGDAELAKELMYQHIETSKQSVLRHFRLILE